MFHSALVRSAAIISVSILIILTSNVDAGINGGKNGKVEKGSKSGRKRNKKGKSGKHHGKVHYYNGHYDYYNKRHYTRKQPSRSPISRKPANSPTHPSPIATPDESHKGRVPFIIMRPVPDNESPFSSPSSNMGNADIAISLSNDPSEQNTSISKPTTSTGLKWNQTDIPLSATAFQGIGEKEAGDVVVESENESKNENTALTSTKEGGNLMTDIKTKNDTTDTKIPQGGKMDLHNEIDKNATPIKPSQGLKPPHGSGNGGNANKDTTAGDNGNVNFNQGTEPSHGSEGSNNSSNESKGKSSQVGGENSKIDSENQKDTTVGTENDKVVTIEIENGNGNADYETIKSSSQEFASSDDSKTTAEIGNGNGLNTNTVIDVATGNKNPNFDVSEGINEKPNKLKESIVEVEADTSKEGSTIVQSNNTTSNSAGKNSVDAVSEEKKDSNGVDTDKSKEVSSTAVFCAEASKDKAVNINWIYAVEFTQNMTKEQRTEAITMMELQLVSDIFYCNDTPNKKPGIEGVAGLDYKPLDAKNEDVVCFSNSTNGGFCETYFGRMTMYLEHDVEEQIAVNDMLYSIRNTMQRRDFPSMDAIVQVWYLEPELNDASRISDSSDLMIDSKKSESGNSLTAGAKTAFAALGVFVFAAVVLGIFRMRRNHPDGVSTIFSSRLTTDSNNGFDLHQASFSAMLPNSYRLEETGMSCIMEDDSDSEKYQSSVIISDGGYTSDGDSQHQMINEIYPPYLEPVLGAQKINEESIEVEADRDLLFDNDDISSMG